MSSADQYEGSLRDATGSQLDLFIQQGIYEDLNSIAKQSEEKVFSALRTMSVDEVGALQMSIPEQCAALRAVLPRMATSDVQISWTGTHGLPLLIQSCGFVRSVNETYRNLTGRSLATAQVLDYGCGWGRLIRLMYALVKPDHIHGCDPWAKSIELCRDAGIKANLAVSEYLPTTLPFTGKKFNLIYSFSVFTHLSERAMHAALAACRKHICDDGVMVVTVRPEAYWDINVLMKNQIQRDQFKAAHAASGFAFLPHDLAPIDGDITYGDTSISVDYIKDRWHEWELVASDRLLADPLQTSIFLRPR